MIKKIPDACDAERKRLRNELVTAKAKNMPAPFTFVELRNIITVHVSRAGPSSGTGGPRVSFA